MMPTKPQTVAVWFEIPVSNLDRAVAFYNKILDQEMVIDHSMGPNPIAMFAYDDADGTGTGGHVTPETRQRTARPCIYPLRSAWPICASASLMPAARSKATTFRCRRALSFMRATWMAIRSGSTVRTGEAGRGIRDEFRCNFFTRNCATAPCERWRQNPRLLTCDAQTGSFRSSRNCGAAS